MLDIDDSSFDNDDAAGDEPVSPHDPGCDAAERDWVDAELAWPSRPVADDLDVARRLFAHLAGRIAGVGRIGIGAIAPVG